MSSEISTPWLIVQFAGWFGIISALLFVGAGTVAWPQAWLYIFIQTSSSAVTILWLNKHNPKLLQDRMKFWKRLEKPWDKALVILYVPASAMFFVFPGLDAIRYQWSYVPLPFGVMGFVGIVLSSGLVFWVLRTNPYASVAVEIQKDRGHRVITAGPYQYVRHPMYVGAILWIICTPLALGSLITFVPSIILTVLIVIRTYLEDKTLHRELEGYTAYAKTVKFRLMPGVW